MVITTNLLKTLMERRHVSNLIFLIFKLKKIGKKFFPAVELNQSSPKPIVT